MAGPGRPPLPSPRTALSVVSLTYLVAAMVTVRYPPEYLAAPRLWGALAFTASILVAWTASCPTRKIAGLAGSFAVFCALVRSLANVLEVILSPLTEPAQSARLVAACLWAGFGIMLWFAWEHVVIRWVAARRVGLDDPAITAYIAELRSKMEDGE